MYCSKEIFNLIEERLILNLGIEYLLNCIILLWQNFNSFVIVSQ